MIRVGVIYSGDKQVLLNCNVDDNATVEQVIAVSGILRMCQDIDLKKQKVGIFGRFVKLNSSLKDGDRIEIYRKIIRDLEDDDDDED